MSTTFTPATRAPISAARARAVAGYRNLALWTLQGWAAMFFFAAGYAKLTEPLDNLVALMNWPALVSENLVRGVGIVEVVLALGMLAPLMSWKLGRWPLLISAAGLIALEVVMLAVHAFSFDIGLALTNLALLAITIPVLLGRR
ncbi:DoxX family protein [Brevundimonas sp.]|uniref:DoxX family protein n=1 Tax=Brevundimonas sp. TaxID=1871086 RepID=UPI002636D92C|nr:DoxX family protein [Brevundimonas sp.]